MIRHLAAAAACTALAASWLYSGNSLVKLAAVIGCVAAFCALVAAAERKAARS